MNVSLSIPHFPFLSLNFSCMWGFSLSHRCGVPIHMYISKFGLFFVNMSHVDMIIKPVGRT